MFQVAPLCEDKLIPFSVFLLPGSAYIFKSKIIKHIVDQSVFVLRQIPPGLILQHLDDAYGLFCEGKIYPFLVRKGIGQFSEVYEGRSGEGEYEGRKSETREKIFPFECVVRCLRGSACIPQGVVVRGPPPSLSRCIAIFFAHECPLIARYQV